MRNGQNSKMSVFMCRLLSIVNEFKSLFKNQIGRLNVMVYISYHLGGIWSRIQSSQPAVAKKCQLQDDNCTLVMASQTCRLLAASNYFTD